MAMESSQARSAPLQAWLDWVALSKTADPEALIAPLSAQLSDSVTFISPVVFTPQVGRELTIGYLMSAMQVLHNGFRYLSIIEQDGRAALEFEAEIDGTTVNGIDLIDFDQDGKIAQFKVMVRPLKGIQAVHAKMAEALAALKSA